MAEWFVQVDGKRYGPFDSAKLVKLAAAGKVKPDDLVKKGRDGEWKPAHRVRRLFDAGTQANYGNGDVGRAESREAKSNSSRRGNSASREQRPASAGASTAPSRRTSRPKRAPAAEPLFDLSEAFDAAAESFDENPYSPPMSVPVAEAPVDRRAAQAPTMLGLLFSFRGRIPRRYYWGANIGVGVVFNIAESALDGLASQVPVASALAFLLLLVVFVWITLAVQAKRLHDRDRSAWWLLLNLIPCVGAVLLFIELGCRRGTVGSNAYGPDPT
ncbi:MAG: DUF805 domain-containing protein [Planctomycetales bacterium]|nr:DUF805 domain-containing protein [Planctomycetales bacterium]